MAVLTLEISLHAKTNPDPRRLAWKPHETDPILRMGATELLIHRKEEFKVKTSLVSGYYNRDKRFGFIEGVSNWISELATGSEEKLFAMKAKTHIVANVTQNVIIINLTDGAEPVVLEYTNEQSL